MSNKAEIIIKLDAQGQREVQAALGGVRRESTELKGSVGTLDKSFVGLGIGAGAAVVAIGSLGSKMLDTAKQFQKLDAMLKTATGSSIGAADAMGLVLNVAKDTPYQVTELTTAFIKLKNLGLDPSKASLISYGNIAAGMGKDLDQMIEAVADASVGEFERLKEFGIKASKQGEQVTFTFRGVKTTVQSEAAAITGYLQKLGNVQFAGAMTEQMDGLQGATSNMEDAWSQLLNSLANTGPAEAAAQSMRDLTTVMQDFRRLLDPTKQEQITALESTLANAIEQMEQARKHADWTWNPWGDPAEWQERVNTLKAQLDELKGLDPYSQDVAALKRTAATYDRSKETDTGGRFYEPDAGMVQMDIAAGNAMAEDTWLMRKMGLDQAAQERAKTAYLELQQYFAEQDLLEREAEIQANEEQLLQRQEFLDRQTAQEEKAAQKRKRIEEDLQKKKVLMWQNASRAGLGILQMLQSGSIKESKKGFEIAKAAAIAETTINTYKAATGAYSALAAIPYVGPALGAAAAAAAIAAGMANVSSISSQSFGGGASPSATSYGNPGTPTNPVSVAPPPAAQNNEHPTEGAAVHVNFYGYTNAQDKDGLARELVAAIREAEEDGF